MHIKIASDKMQLFSYFILVSITGAFLLQLPQAYVSGTAVPFVDSLFTSMSAVCVTGLSSVPMSTYTSFGFVIIAILIELGGFGIISFISIAFAFPKKKVSLVSRRMVRDFSIDEIEYNPRKIVGNIVFFMLGIQLLGSIALFFAFSYYKIENPLFPAIFHSIAAFCNAGFSTFDSGLAQFRYSPSINIIIMLLIVFGGIGFIVLKNIYQKFRYNKKISLHTKLVLIVTAVLICGGALIIFINDYNGAFKNDTLFQKILSSFFQSITTRTAGFETVPQREFSPANQFITIILMFIGGSPASIAGGIKTTTFFIVLLYIVKGNYTKQGLPVFSRHINQATTEKAFEILFKSVILVFFSIFLLLITEKNLIVTGVFSITDIIFETVSAFGTVGLSQGITGDLSVAGKLIIIATMFIGRTGIFTMSLALFGGEKERLIEYPDENVLVG